MWVAFANAKATHFFFSKNIGIYAMFNDQSFNNTLTNDMVTFEQLGPAFYLISVYFYNRPKYYDRQAGENKVHPNQML